MVIFCIKILFVTERKTFISGHFCLVFFIRIEDPTFEKRKEKQHEKGG